MRRREFITLLGGAAACPLASRAQRRERMRRIGMLMAYNANDPQAQTRNAAFLQGLQQLGWTVGQNVQIDYRKRHKLGCAFARIVQIAAGPAIIDLDVLSDCPAQLL